MYEITYNDKKELEIYIHEGKAYKGGIYDFTLENRFIIYHTTETRGTIYYALDKNTTLAVEVLQTNYSRKINYRTLLPYIYKAIKYTGDRRYLALQNGSFDPLDLIESIFKHILPQYGYIVRDEQVELSKQIYKGFTDYSISLCEAEVGTGKSLAYLIAAVITKKHLGFKEPITISTSNIELQKSLLTKEIPAISKILADCGIIERPLTAVLRKGKEHYFCLCRYKDFIDKIKLYPLKYQSIIDYFDKTNFSKRAFDLDEIKIPGSIKGKVCVNGNCHKCKFSAECKYKNYINKTMTTSGITFQITNHNLFLTSLRLLKEEGSSLISNSGYVIIDEAHKLKEAAQDVFGESICKTDIPKYLNSIKFLCKDGKRLSLYKELLAVANNYNHLLFSYLTEKQPLEDTDLDQDKLFDIDINIIKLLKRIINTLFELECLRDQLPGNISNTGKRLINSLSVFIEPQNISAWLKYDSTGVSALCCTPKNTAKTLHNSVWNTCSHFVLTSGTMTDGNNFEYFKQETGINLHKKKIQLSSTPSPYNYEKNTRLYIPEGLPFPDNSESYLDAISDQIVRLIKATNGHAAILFTSYKTLHAVFEKTRDLLSQYDLFCMSRSNKTAIADFKKSKNGVLFASGSMWEGVDCVGDCLSSVIIVRLPFPIRSAALTEKKKESISTLSFIDTYAVPEMLIKLRQGIGRLIRSESDTGLISILDNRALNSPYAERVQKVLKKYPQVSSLHEVEDFFKQVKPQDYFTE